MFLANTNGNPDGRLTGPQTVPILLGLNAPKHVLKDVWELSDADKDGCLSWSEFVVAVYLTAFIAVILTVYFIHTGVVPSSYWGTVDDVKDVKHEIHDQKRQLETYRALLEAFVALLE